MSRPQSGQEHGAALLMAGATKKAREDDLKKAVKTDLAKAQEVAAEIVQLESAAEPVRRRYLVNDTTVEKLGEILNQNPNGVTIFRDELISFFRSLDKDGQEGARGFYLTAWNGDARYTYDRIGRGTLDITAACLSMIGGTQPGPLGDYLRAAVMVEKVTTDGSNGSNWPSGPMRQRRGETSIATRRPLPSNSCLTPACDLIEWTLRVWGRSWMKTARSRSCDSILRLKMSSIDGGVTSKSDCDQTANSPPSKVIWRSTDRLCRASHC